MKIKDMDIGKNVMKDNPKEKVSDEGKELKI